MKLISPTYINVKGRLLDLATPQVMGITYRTGDRKPESSGCYRFGRYFPGGCSRTVCGGVWRSYRQ